MHAENRIIGHERRELDLKELFPSAGESTDRPFLTRAVAMPCGSMQSL
jgi:hypothetical protein